MKETAETETLDAQRFSRRMVIVFVSVATGLALAVLLTRVAASIHTRVLLEDELQAQTAIIERVRAHVQNRFNNEQRRMLGLAERIANEERVRSALWATSIHDSVTSRPEHLQLIDWFGNLNVHRMTAAELYAPDGRLIAWTTFSMPLGDDSLFVFPDRLQSGTVSDDVGREALYLWLPVTDGTSIIGRIRILRMTQVPVNIPSAYLQPYDLREELTHDREGQVSIGFRPVVGGGEPEPKREHRFPLLAADGKVSGYVQVEAPPIERVVRSTRDKYRDLEIFWLVLLGFWVMFALLEMYRRWLEWADGHKREIRLREALAFLGLIAAVLVGLRYVLLAFDIPGRWFMESDFFDPRFLASSLAGGLARSIGDLVLSVVCAFVLAVWTVHMSFRVTFPSLRSKSAGLEDVRNVWLKQRGRTSWPLMCVASGATLLLLLAVALAFAVLVRRVIFDSTLDYFAWTGLSPEPVVLAVMAALVTAALTASLFSAAILRGYFWSLARFSSGISARKQVLAIGLPAVMIFVSVFAVSSIEGLLPWWMCLLIWGAGLLFATLAALMSGNVDRVLTVKMLLLIVLVSSMLVYPLIYKGMMLQRQMRMEDVADDFIARKDAELQLVIDHVLDQAYQELTDSTSAGSPFPEGFLVNADIPLQDEYRLTITVLDDGEHPVAGQASPSSRPGEMPEDWQNAFSLLRPRLDLESLYMRLQGWVALSDDGSGGTYAGLERVGSDQNTRWVIATASPLSVQFSRQDPSNITTGLPSYADWRSKLAMAEYRTGRLVRTEGSGFEKARIPPEVAQTLESSPIAWSEETVYETPYLTFYKRQQDEDADSISPIVAVRARAVIPYDHLYYLLRVIYAGLWVGLIGFLLGWLLRYRRLIEPRSESRFRDKVIDAFLWVGAIGVLLMGLIGQQVIHRENQGAVQSRLERRLSRVANALDRYASPDESPFHALDRISVEELADELSLDLNIYRGSALSESSGTGEQEQLLVYTRLPVRAYRELYLQGFNQSFVTLETEYGASYTMGYLAVRDQAGIPAAVVAVLTIPEQARIQEDRARTTAYLYGALLVLLLVIMTTAIFLAQGLARPIRRLRDGLATVAAGAYHQPIPVESNDEVGGLVRSFNEMQEQLVESRKKLAQHEREIAWREMAKQVAHEIKNPLTPMKLSIQHLQRAFMESQGGGEARGKFGALFKRISGTLISQIDSLAHIANEFYSFARLPKRHLETLDMNTVVRETIDLFKDEQRVTIQAKLWRTALLVEGDREELQRLFINLIKNGVQAIPAGEEGSVAVQIWPDEEHAHVLCSITDTGQGIPDDLRDKIFQPNFSTKTSGMGLGLAIVKKTVEDMQGEISFDSWEGGGTTFTVQLPLKDHTK